MNTSTTLLDHVERWCNLTPDAMAVVTTHEKLTYGELAQYSDAVATFLHNHNIGPGRIVPIEATRTVDFIVGLLGIMKTGAAYSPIDHGYPEKRKSYIIEQTQAPLTLTTIPPKLFDRKKLDRRAVSVASLRQGNKKKITHRPLTSDAIYVIFTSGTTGVPKGVIVEHYSVEAFVIWHNKQFSIDQSTRSTLMAALGFDVAHWEIWSPLSAGGTLYMPDDETRRDVDLLIKMLDRSEITHAFVPTVMAHDLIAASRPGPKSLKYLFTGGEKLNPIDTDHIHYQLIDYYGPTEATIWASYHPVSSSSLGLPPSIGKPVCDTQLWILDEQLREPPKGQIGEICISGPCLARGYLHNERQTHEKFLTHPFLQDARIYRTGDLGKWLPDGSVQFLGRTDEQVKIRGHLVELIEIETVIARQLGVRKVSVIATSPVVSGDKEIVAFIIPDNVAILANEIIPNIREGIGSFLPDYMMPGKYLVVDTFPENVNGKTDKASLRSLFEQHKASVPLHDYSAIADVLERSIFEVFAKTLGHTDFDDTGSFFDIGGHSLLAAQVVVHLSKHFKLPLRITDLYNHPSVTTLATEIKRRLQSSDEISDHTSPETLRNDATLPEDIIFSGAFDNRRLENAEHLLLTGVTGFVGIHLLAELLERTEAVVHCIVRAEDANQADLRLAEKLTQYMVSLSASQKARIRLYIGDISEPWLGLIPADYDALSLKIDVIHHSASAVNFIKPYSSMKQDNVDGLINLIRFAAAGRIKAMMLLSTISVYSWGYWITGKKLMREDDDIDQNLPAICADIGYVKSKWAMETIADQAESRGMPLMTFRLGYATYHAKTGISASYQWWGRLVKTCIELGAIPDLEELREGLSTVDYMSKAVSHISKNSLALGKKFNLIHSGDRNVSLKGFFMRLAEHFGYKFQILPFHEWRDLWENDDSAPLYPVLNLFKDPMYEGKCILELYQHTYDWKHDNTQNFLEGSDILQPEFDAKELAHYLRHSIGVFPAG
ncbi:amino acid adenylation domain-containing protein [Pseudomonas sp. PDM25]|uniref:amino acid adenylation domain-containing protein n=1 Tax=Pseudomonas sp. PDM25 TaxID=2854772 RepID=UPI001C4598EA|nr:amino acid adenylation domain-containing protein [Pseudomonas sp. PDM25]MBV7515718.1 amino acid adenylation domain-containing protein [Pseudomonas sp. PDM25]